MHYYKTIQVNTLAIFLQEIERLKSKGYNLVGTSTGKGLRLNSPNAVECEAEINAILRQGTSIITIVCEI